MRTLNNRKIAAQKKRVSVALTLGSRLHEQQFNERGSSKAIEKEIRPAAWTERYHVYSIKASTIVDRQTQAENDLPYDHEASRLRYRPAAALRSRSRRFRQERQNILDSSKNGRPEAIRSII